MAPATQIYRAFISYSHSDDAVAARLHRRIERFRPPKHINDGKRIAPVFRDREELATSSNLPHALQEALAGSEALIVLCSPRAAASQWVGEEICLFAARHGAARIHPVIVGGEPPDCFPPALLDIAPEPLAADLRDVGDGFADGSLKLIAGLLNAPYGEIKNRELIVARRRARINGGLAAVFALLLVAALIAAWQAVRQTARAEEELARAEAATLVAVRGVEGVIGQVTRDAQTGRIRKVVAEDLLTSARENIEAVIAIAPDDLELQVEYGELLTQFAEYHRSTGDLSRSAAHVALARDRLEDVVAKTEDPDAKNWLANVRIEQAEHHRLAGRHEDARAAAAEALALYQQIDDLDATQPQWLVNQAVAMERVARAAHTLGDRSDGVRLAEGAIAFLSARFTPARYPPAGRQIALLHALLAEFHFAADPAAASAHAEAASEILTALLAADPGNVLFRRDLSFVLIDKGELLAQSGDLAGAIAQYERALESRAALSEFDPQNLLYRRDLSLAHERLGLAWSDLNAFDAALTHFERSAEIAAELSAHDPENASWREDAAIAAEQVGHQNVLNGDLGRAYDAFHQAIGLRYARAADRDAAMAAESAALMRAAQEHLDREEFDDALGAFFHGYVLLAERVERNPGGDALSAVWLSLKGVADAYRLLGQNDTARHFYQQAIEAAFATSGNGLAIVEMSQTIDALNALETQVGGAAD